MNRRRAFASRHWRTALTTAALMAGVAACGSGGGGAQSDPTSYKGKTLTVWLMAGDNPQSWVDAVTTQFEAAYPGAKLVVQPQQWTGIQSKMTSALAGLTPPDVVEIGNTQTAYYASTGGLLPLDPYRKDLGGADWTPSMDKSTIVGNKQFAAPWFAGNRVVMYNKKLWKAAGLNPPQTMAEWLTDLGKLQHTKGVSSALYLPGQNWYAFDGFLQDAGADILTLKGNQWVGDLDSPAALKAANLFKKLQSYGKAPKDQDEQHPVQATVFAKGDVASMIAMGYEEAPVIAANKSMDGNIGYFPIPGDTAGKPAKTFLGGSNLAVAETSTQRTMALGFLKIALDDENEKAYVKLNGFLPNKASLYSALDGNAYAAAAQKAAPNAGFTPLVRAWANVENPPNPISTLFLTPILEGKDPVAAAKAADAKLTARIKLG
ncbi:extracellular solute-binding protein [Streptacidiphilus sp. N1-12]|uniref:Extracellular solute-binding protein n=2 Tax=Streptacidiphilus alkalitolerans TaxID=3342712 RepID=A0ABV6WK44_9ACTN